MSTEPAEFCNGLDAFHLQEDPGRRPGLPPLSSFEHAPYEVERYLGRVEDVDEQGTVTARLWEVPNGRSGVASFASSTRFEPEQPKIGAGLFVWVWAELPEGGEPVIKTLARVENPVLTEDDRRALLKVAASLKGGVA